MPLLPPETTLFPPDLLARPVGPDCESRWWVIHTRPRAEKSLARKLVDTRGKLVCLAEIKEMQQDVHNPNIKVPRMIKLTYPAERELDKIQLTLVMDTVAVNTPVDRAMASVWFFCIPRHVLAAAVPSPLTLRPRPADRF